MTRIRALVFYAALSWAAMATFNFGVFNADESWRCQHELMTICDEQQISDGRVRSFVFGVTAAPISLIPAVSMILMGGRGWSLYRATPTVERGR